MHPRVLIVGTVPYNTKSTSRAFDAYFHYWEKENIAQIFSNTKKPCKGHCETLFQITDHRVLQRWMGKKVDTGVIYHYDELDTEWKDNNLELGNAKAEAAYKFGGKHTPLTHLLRGILWRKRFWCTEKLNNWLDDFKPECVFLAFSDDYFIPQIAMYVAKRYNVPIVSCIGDDYYFNVEKTLNPIYHLYKSTYKKLIDKVLTWPGSAIYISDKIRDKYNSEFGLDGETVYLTSTVQRKPFSVINKDCPVITYFGNIGMGRNNSLNDIGYALGKINPEYMLEVYSNEKDEQVYSVFKDNQNVKYMLLAFFVGLLTARYLGPSNFGLINYAATYTSFFASFCTLGINSVIVKNFVDYPDEEGETVGSAIVLRTVSSVLSVLMMVCITLIADKGETTTHIVVFLCGIGVIFQVMDTLDYWFQSKLESKYSAFATVISYTVVSAYKVWLLATGKSVEWFAISTSIDYMVVAVVLLVMYKKHNGPQFKCSVRKAKELFSNSYHFILAGLMVSIYGSTDKFMLKQMLNESEVGFYSTAVSLCNTWVFLLTAIIDSLYPVILQSFDNKKLFERKNKQLYAIVFYVSVGVSLLFSLLASPIVSILYGDAYAPAAAPLRIITWYTAFSYLGVARNAWVVSYSKQNYLKYLYIGATITNVLLNAIMIPLWGASGAALASLLTQISTILLFPAVIKDLQPNVKLMIDAILLKDVF